MPEAVDPQEDRSVTGLSQLLFVHSEVRSDLMQEDTGNAVPGFQLLTGIGGELSVVLYRSATWPRVEGMHSLLPGEWQ